MGWRKRSTGHTLQRQEFKPGRGLGRAHGRTCAGIQFFAKGMVSAAVDSHFGSLEAAQIEFHRTARPRPCAPASLGPVRERGAEPPTM